MASCVFAPATAKFFEFPQMELISIVYPTESEFRNWRIQIGAALAARQGNSEQQDVSVDASLRRNRAFTRWTNTYTGVFSRVDGERTTNNHRAATDFDYLVGNRFFIRLTSFEFFLDQFQNIDGRYTPA